MLFSRLYIQPQAVIVLRVRYYGVCQAYLHPDGETVCSFRKGCAAGDGDGGAFAGGQGREGGFGLADFAVVVFVGNGDGGGRQCSVAVVLHIEGGGAGLPFRRGDLGRGIGGFVYGAAVPKQSGPEGACGNHRGRR